MAAISMKALLETGVHFGHRTRKWHPKMKPYIFTERNGIHIIDLQQTVVQLRDVFDAITRSIADGGTVLFVGTKRQAQETIQREAERCQMPYVNTRWLGGTLTNWRTIRERIDTLKRMERQRDEGGWEKLTKKERLLLERKLARLQFRLGGIRDMKKLPDMVFIIDVNREHTAIKEANILKIPVIAVVDTNCDPDPVDFLIAGNDDAIRAIKLISSIIADAVEEGRNIRLAQLGDEAMDEDMVDAYATLPADEDDDSAYLGEATLRKLRDTDLFGSGEDDDADLDGEENED